MTNYNTALSNEQVARIAWQRGLLEYKLDDNQKTMAQSIVDGTEIVSTMLASRRIGKTHTLMVWSFMQCIKNPNYIVKFVTSTKEAAYRITRDVVREILKDCPDDLRPKFDKRDYMFKWPNGSEIQLAGTDKGNAEKIRGQMAHLCIVDEAGFCDELRYVVGSILLPLVSTTKGKVMLVSTPPKKKSHEFNTYIREAKLKQKLKVFTIFDNPRIDFDTIEMMAKEVGGMESDTFKREFLCDTELDDDSRLVPEFTEETKMDTVLDWAKPGMYDGYVSADVGGKDWTFVVFAYYDFKADKVVVEDELILKGNEMTTSKFALEVFAKERQHFIDIAGDKIDPYLRISDVNLIFINDLAKDFGLKFRATKKDDLHSQVNELRFLIGEKKIIINPRCKELILQLELGTWDKNRTKFDHLENGSHCDGVAALMYLVRNINFKRNPYPAEQVSYVNKFYVPAIHDRQGKDTSWDSLIKSSASVPKSGTGGGGWDMARGKPPSKKR